MVLVPKFWWSVPIICTPLGPNIGKIRQDNHNFRAAYVIERDNPQHTLHKTKKKNPAAERYLRRKHQVRAECLKAVPGTHVWACNSSSRGLLLDSEGT